MISPSYMFKNTLFIVLFLSLLSYSSYGQNCITIDQQPQDQLTLDSDDIVLTVAATSTENLLFQQRRFDYLFNSFWFINCSMMQNINKKIIKTYLLKWNVFIQTWQCEWFLTDSNMNLQNDERMRIIMNNFTMDGFETQATCIVYLNYSDIMSFKDPKKTWLN